MTRAAKAYAPGHVSGLFAVHDEAADVLARGSRGAGWSVDAGATAKVQPAQATTIAIDGEVAPAATTRRALALLAPQAHFDVHLALGLPVGQGFGMSAAGSLAACLAAASLLDLEPEAALAAAHRAEVESGTGLGDAVACWFGSGEVRMRPGCPPTGWATRVEPPGDARMLYLVAGSGIATRKVIRDDAWKRRTRELGDPAVDRILAAGRRDAWGSILAESSSFSRALGLMPAWMEEAGGHLPPEASWGQCMLGTTMWVAGSSEALQESRRRMAGLGTIVEAGIDHGGARLVR